MNQYKSNRLDSLFNLLKNENRSALGIFITASDPNLETSLNILKGLPDAGADMIELGMPFSDPMADGPAIQASSQRALKSGGCTNRTLSLVKEFRKDNSSTPIVLMGYYNPIYIFGVQRFLDEAIESGVDGIIVVDLPPEEDAELCLPTRHTGLPFIRLTSPTTDENRIPKVLNNTSGFIYYISITGITGTQEVPIKLVSSAVSKLRKYTELPIAVGFGIRTPEHVKAVTEIADAAIVGSAVVDAIAACLNLDGTPKKGTAQRVLNFVATLAEGVRGKMH